MSNTLRRGYASQICEGRPYRHEVAVAKKVRNTAFRRGEESRKTMKNLVDGYSDHARKYRGVCRIKDGGKYLQGGGYVFPIDEKYVVFFRGMYPEYIISVG